MPKIARKPPKAGEAVWNSFFLVVIRGPDLDLGVLTSKTVRKYVSVVKATHFEAFSTL